VNSFIVLSSFRTPQGRYLKNVCSSVRGRLQRHIKLSLSPNRPNLLIQEVSGLFFIQRDIEVPKDLGEHKPQLSICKITSDTVPDADRPGLECGVVVICKNRIGPVEVALWDKFARPSEVVIGEVGA
jgi:hypothetical protein